jgi:UDP-glucose 4-epimerase
MNFVLGSNLDPVFEKERMGDIKYSFADVHRAKEKLEFSAKTELREGLKKTIEWHKSKR